MTHAWEGYGVRVVREPQFQFPKPSVATPADAYGLLQRQLAWEDREVFCTVILDTQNHVLGVNTVSVGSVSASLVYPRETFKPALIMGASGIILAHNHPSGDPTPSQDDLELTRRLRDAGIILEIPILDHIIIAETRFFSFKEHGLL